MSVKYLDSDLSHPAIAISRQGDKFAYLVKAPNLATNRNDIEVYVQSLLTPAKPAKPLLIAGTVSQPQWLRDGRHLVLLSGEPGSRSVVSIDVDSGRRRILASHRSGIEEYGIDQDAHRIAFSVKSTPEQRDPSPTADERAHGYRVLTTRPAESFLPITRIFVMYRRGNGKWTKPRPISLSTPFLVGRTTEIPYKGNGQLSLSPTGRWLSISFPWIDRVPTGWRKSAFVRDALSKGFQYSAQVIYDLQTETTRVAFPTPSIASVPLWSMNGDDYAVVARSPVGSKWEDDELGDHQTASPYRVYTVEVESGQVSQIPSSSGQPLPLPLSWSAEGVLTIQTEPESIRQFSHKGSEWVQDQVIHLPEQARSHHSGDSASNGTHLVAVYERSQVPPVLISYNFENQSLHTVAELNPEFGGIELGPIEEIRWKTSSGYEVRGLLLKPVDYVPGKVYPLVIQTKADMGSFVCDFGEDHYPSFAPRPIAAAGMMYLMRTYPKIWTQQEEINHYPHGLPGNLSEAAFQMDLWDSAVGELVSRGLVAPDRVGIIGFSRTGWYTEFMLAHAKTRYAAATVADNIQYSLGEYWHYRYDANVRGYDSLYGGPPYGATLANWLKYSVSFNLDKIRTPLLMEVMGYGVSDRFTKAPPTNLATKWEVSAGLERLHKPVEVYYYPDEEHQPDHPQARLASLERNVDWFRFWLLGQEDPDPGKTDQYDNWRRLREMQNSSNGHKETKH